jgi:serine/threonine protein kinase
VNGEQPAILGTPDFMAPEVVRQEVLPSIETDKFSLAVMLFYLFLIDHPLKGQIETAFRIFDLPAREKLFGKEPVYVFDPNDQSNRPVPGVHDNAIAFEKVYPTFLKKLFEKAFTTGLKDPKNGRVTENEWKAAMVRLRDSIFYCRHCGAENFYDPDNPPPAVGRAVPCWACHKDIVLPFRIRIDKAVIMLNHDTSLYLHHMDAGKRFDFSTPVGEVVQHPKDPTIWGLRNRMKSKWVFTAPDGTLKDVEPGRSVPFATGIKVNFGTADGEIRY